MALVIGSVALNKYIPGYRKPKDLDVFARPDDPTLLKYQANQKRVEPFWHDNFSNTPIDRDGFATLDELYTIKVSHAYWELNNGSWQKHMADINAMKSIGAKLDMDLHKLLYNIWTVKHGSKKMNLNQEADSFFKDAVVRIYDHDSIHRSVAFGEYPLYEDILKDGATVDIDPVKLWSMDHETLVKLFREEIAATALERWMIPTEYKFSAGRAYHLALKKTIVSLTRGKSARFIVTHFEDFCKPHDYMSIHNAKRDKLERLEK